LPLNLALGAVKFISPLPHFRLAFQPPLF